MSNKIFSLNVTEEEVEQAKEKVRRLEVPSDFQVDTPEVTSTTFNVGDVLDGNVVLPASHAGEEFLHMLLDDPDTVTKWVCGLVLNQC